MMSENKPQNQKNLFNPLLKEFINPEHELVKLSGRINWTAYENEFQELYSHTGRPAKTVRLMVSFLLLKRLYNLSDEKVVEAWVQNPYFQYFSGMAEFQWNPLIDPSELVHFRKRIGEKGAEFILKQSIELHGASEDKYVVIDTTAQEKNITFPTDSKLRIKIINQCRDIANKHQVPLRQSYVRVVKQLKQEQRFGHHPRRRKKANNARKKLKTIAGRLVRELRRKLPEELQEQYERKLKLFEKVLEQKREDKNKIYSLHEPEVACIAKGKAHKPYEFGSKVSFALSPSKGIILGAVNFTGNPHDSKTVEQTLENMKVVAELEPKEAYGDRGYRGKKKIGKTEIITPRPGKTTYQKRKLKKRFGERTGIEPIIGHIKHDHRMVRNYLKGVIGDQMNAILAAAGFNYRKMLNQIKEEIYFFILKLIQWMRIYLQNLLTWSS